MRFAVHIFVCLDVFENRPKAHTTGARTRTCRHYRIAACDCDYGGGRPSREGICNHYTHYKRATLHTYHTHHGSANVTAHIAQIYWYASVAEVQEKYSELRWHVKCEQQPNCWKSDNEISAFEH